MTSLHTPDKGRRDLLYKKDSYSKQQQSQQIAMFVPVMKDGLVATELLSSTGTTKHLWPPSSLPPHKITNLIP